MEDIYNTNGATDARTSYISNIRKKPIVGTSKTLSGASVNSDGSLASAPEKEAPSRADMAFSSYLESLKADTAETSARSYLNKLITQSSQDQEKALGMGETRGFATGEAARVGRQNQLAIDAAARGVDSLTASRGADRDISKARFDYEQSKLSKEEEALEKQMGRQFELSPGQTRFGIDPETGEYKEIASLPSIPKAPSTADPKGTTRSGGLTYTPEMAAEDTAVLEQSRAENGFVDANMYQQLYNEWIASGGLLKDFLSKFPPALYVDPNASLPTYLKPKSTDKKISTPFGSTSPTSTRPPVFSPALAPFANPGVRSATEAITGQSKIRNPFL